MIATGSAGGKGPRSGMLPLLLALAPLLSGCGEGRDSARGPVSRPVPDRPVRIVLEGIARTPGGKATFRADLLLAPPDRLAGRTVRDGVVHRFALEGGRAWLRAGAAVADLPAGEAGEIRRWRAVLRSLLRGEPVLPAPGEALALSGERSFGGLRLPAKVTITLREGAETFELAPVAARVGDVGEDAPIFSRPGDRGPGSAGEIVRRRERGARLVRVVHEGPLTDLARVDHFLRESLARAHARARGPIERVFRRFPDERGRAVMETLVPVSFSEEPGGGDLLPGSRAGQRGAGEVLAMPFTGPYPRDDSLYVPLRRRAAALGLEVAGLPRHRILSDPDAGEPADLRQEIVLPVR